MDNLLLTDITGQAHFIDGYIIILLGIMIISGILGGSTNYFLITKNKEKTWKVIFRSLLWGIVSALTVPFFLHTLSNNLLDAALTKRLNLLVFSGLCIIFSLIACQCFEIFRSKKIEIPHKVKKELPVMHPTITYSEKVESSLPYTTNKKAGLSENHLKIIKAMTIPEGESNDRSLAGLLMDSGIQKEQFNDIISSLIAKGYIGQYLNNAGKLRFSLTPKGQHSLDRLQID